MLLANLTVIVASISVDAARSRALDENSPSPERIREMTAEIRRGWSREERRRRARVRYVELLEMRAEPRRRGFQGPWT